MTKTAQSRAVQTYRARLSQRGMARFEVVGLETDRDLIRTLARQLADAGPAAQLLRTSVRRSVSPDRAATGGILAALRASPLVGADLDLSRDDTDGRVVEL